MAIAEKTEIFDIEPAKFYQAILNYNSYPEFVDGVSSIKVLSNDEKGAELEYSLNLIKKFSYKLKHTHKLNEEVSWSLISGDLFKSNKGSWKLKDLGNGKTEVTYSIEVDFKMFAPAMVVNKLVANNLPATMKSFYERAKQI